VKQTGKNFVVAVTNLSQKKLEFLSVDSHPDMPIRIALRMSMSIPVMFDPVTYDDVMYVDAMIVDNFPIRFFKRWREDGQTVGLRICIRKPDEPIRDVLAYFQALFYTSTIDACQPHMSICDVNCANVKNFDMKTMCFNTSSDTFDTLIGIGEESGSTFLQEFFSKNENKSESSRLPEYATGA